MYQLAMQNDDAWWTINELGKLNCLHFIDLNKNRLTHEQSFAKIVKAMDETERKLE